MSAVTTHMLDTAAGRPAAGVDVTLEQEVSGTWTLRGRGTTDDDGRVTELLPAEERPHAGTWRLSFDTGAWAAAQQRACFHPSITIAFVIEDPAQHYHVPVLWSPYGYSTYRGS
ncbi:MAG: 5-hydroxyisourate hydrolase [Planctomycetota bacterium]|nr:MAG: 5-hydroxyisourate hydrolase [Planctomycetota bacterium]